MKTIVLLSIILLASCSPHIQYLGDTYSPTSKVEFFYDEKDIASEYKVMGIILNEASEYNDLEDVKTAMLEKSKSVGADGILFEAVENERIGPGDHVTFHSKRSFFSSLFSDDKKGVVIKAKLIKFN